MDALVLPATTRHQRAEGALDLTVAAGPRGASLRDLRQSSPFRALFPAPEPDEVTTVALVNTAGGLAGGDAGTIRLRAEPGARLTVSTAAAEKVYRSLGDPARLSVHLDLRGDAAVEWIPQETILFDGARLARRTEADLAPDARLLLTDTLVLGRAARGESFGNGAVRDAWRIRRDGRLLWADGLRLDGGTMPLTHPFGFAGAGASALLLLAAPRAEDHLNTLRAALDAVPDALHHGATVPRPGLLLARFLGTPSTVRRALAAALLALRAAAFGLPARLPRLWTT